MKQQEFQGVVIAMEQVIDKRQEKGKELARAIVKDKDNSKFFTLPPKTYQFSQNSCDCLDSIMRRIKCKHQWAVTFYLQKRNEKYTDAFKILLLAFKKNSGYMEITQATERFGDELIDKALENKLIFQQKGCFIILE